ncbi:MAG: ComF family protein [wastewater metagenome]|nr:ComF family protein [Candidatus Loosdrechtia aerotolerans]
MIFDNYLHAFLDLFYPRSCLHCKRNLNNSCEFYLCNDCKGQISYLDNTQCIRCGAVPGPYTVLSTKGCSACKGKYLHFDTIVAVAYYEGVMRTLLHAFKYGRQRFLFMMLNDIILQNKKLYDIVPEIDIIVPVPLYWLKNFHRGFNQSELLSKGIQRHFLKPVSINNLYRIRNTSSQTQLSKTQRQVNIHDAFIVKHTKQLRGKKILLVDDVLTTGVTAAECSKKLKEAGVQSVHLLVLAIAIL